MVRLTREPIDLVALHAVSGADGALCLFAGVVRNENVGRRVTHLEYEAYEEMALEVLKDIEAQARKRWPVTDDGTAFSAATGDFQFAAAVAGFGLLLRDSQYKGNLNYAAALELAQGGVGRDEHGFRAELVEMIRRAKALRGE